MKNQDTGKAGIRRAHLQNQTFFNRRIENKLVYPLFSFSFKINQNQANPYILLNTRPSFACFFASRSIKVNFVDRLFPETAIEDTKKCRYEKIIVATP